MIITQDKPKPMFSSGIETEEFSIEMTAEAFDALSGRNLYKNLIRAIIRELSCNAYDAHIAGGNKEEPFRIHLPTELEPFLSVRDYGIGLDDTQIKNIYKTFFKSTKRQDADSIGAWGLGSKSPLGYTDNFSVTAYKDGTKRIYSVFKNEKGIPSIMLLSETQTTERNGLEVSMPVVKSSDINTFSYEAKYVFEWFPVKPISNITIDKEERQYEIENIVEGCHLQKRRNMWGKDSPIAIQGFIEYPITVPNLNDIDSDLQYLLSKPFVLFFDLGELNISMSREELSYSSVTLTAINTKLRKIHEHLSDSFAEKVSKMNSKWDAAAYVLDITRESNSIFSTLATNYLKNGDNKILQSISDHLCDGDTWGHTIPMKLAREQGILPRSFFKSSRRMVVSTLYPRLKYNESGEFLDVNCSATTLFVFNDTKKGGVSRLRHYISTMTHEDNKHITVVMFENIGKGAITKEQKKLIMRKLGYPSNTMLLSETPELTRQGSNKRNGCTVALGSVLKLDHSKWRSVKSMPEGKKLYVPLSNVTSEFMVDVKLVNKDAQDTSSIVFKLKSLKLLDDNTVIYGVRKSEIKNVMLSDDWIDISTIINVALKEYVDNVDNVVYTYTKSRDVLIKYPSVCSVITDVFNIDESNLFNSLCALTEIDRNRYRNLHDVALAFSQLSTDHFDKVSKYDVMIDNMARKIYSKYPLLRHVFSAYDEETLAEFVLYVKAKNNQPTI